MTGAAESTMVTIIHISDTHLSLRAPEHEPAWHEAAAYIRARQPGLVIHTGDIVQDETSEDDRRHALAKLRSLGVDWAAIPGNHDVGDGPPGATTISAGLLKRFEETYGVAHWTRSFGSWTVIGVNAMLFGTETPEEDAEWRWLEGQLAEAGDRSAMVCVHKPPFLIHPDEAQIGGATIPTEARRRFWSLVRKARIRLVACGHRHEYRVLQRDGAVVVWAPTTSALEEETPPIPSNGCAAGLVEYVLSGDTLLHRLVALDGTASLP